MTIIMPTDATLPDIQSSADLRNIPIQKVGIKDVVLPMQVQTAQGILASVATIAMYVYLPSNVKGTHMSRFLQVIQDHKTPLNFESLHNLMQEMLARLESDSGFLRITLPYFIEKTAPVSGVKSMMNYEVSFEMQAHNKNITLTQEVLVPVKSLCPCSKGISEYGAHNQRSHIIIRAVLNKAMPAEDLIRIAEQQSSCELWAILKRADEKYVTEKAYDNPKFVEDLVRDIAVELNKDNRVSSYELSSENFESIHNHSAYAYIQYTK
jgi:GTP cyclohydrolase IB